MTNNRWTDERLDVLATSVESLVKVAEIHQKDIEALGRDVRGLQVEVSRLVEELRNR